MQIGAFEFRKLVQVTATRDRRIVCFAVHRVRRIEDIVEVGLTIRNGTVTAGHKALGVVKLNEEPSSVIPSQIFQCLLGIAVQPPLAEVADQKRRISRLLLRLHAAIDHQNQEAEEEHSIGKF